MKWNVYVIGLLICAIPFGLLGYIWPQLPSIVPVHFGPTGKADGFGSKNEIWVSLSILTFIGFGCFLLLLNVHKIDPKKPVHSHLLMKKIAFAVLFIIVLIECLIVLSARSNETNLDKIIIPVLGLFFAFLGSTFYSLQPNYFVGIRTPWALENAENWKATHKLAGKLWVTGGLLAVPLSFFAPFVFAIFGFIAIVLVICIIPFVFSYRFYKKGNPVAN